MTNSEDIFDLLLTGADGEAPLDDEEELRLRAALWRLLEKRVRYHTMGDSTSIRSETAEEILNSVIYTLSQHMRLNRLTRRALLERDIADVYDDAVKDLERVMARARELYEAALEYEPPIRNIAYIDTLRNIGGFFRRYNPRDMARDIPCDIDYQLCLPVSEQFEGVSYIYEYLVRLLIEQRFLSSLDADALKRLLYRCDPKPEEHLMSIFEPAIANATGAALAGLSVRSLDVPADVCMRLVRELGGLDDDGIRARVKSAAHMLCAALDISEAPQMEYLTRSALTLCPITKAAASNGDLSHVFISL